MRREVPAAVLIGIALAANCRAEDSFDVKVYPCPRAPGAIVLDGRLDEPCWKNAPLVGGFIAYGKTTLATPQTFFRVTYTDAHLYFGVRCDEPSMKRLAAIPQVRDSGGIFRDESIEFFVDPCHDHRTYFQFAVNAAGSMYDAKGSDSHWNAGIAAATGLDRDHWTIEFAIPWRDLGVSPGSGLLLGFNVCRNRHSGAGRQWSYWSRTLSGFHDPARFAHLVLSPAPEQLGSLGGEFRKGGRRGPVRIYSGTGFSRKTYRSLAQDSVARLRQRLVQLEKAGLQGARLQEEARRVRLRPRGASTDAALRSLGEGGREPDPLAREELDKIVGGYRAEIEQVQQVIDGKAELDAAEWTRVDMHVHELISELNDAVWKARLQGLLREI